MPRNSSGTMTLPSPGVPFQSGQTISSAQVNATFADVATEISDSASRSGKGGFSAPVRVPDGTAAAPAYAFGGEINSGWYRAGANDVRLAVGGMDALKLVSGGLSAPTVNTPLILSSTGQVAVTFIETSAGAGTQRAQLVYDSGAAFGAPSWVFQNLTDAGGFVANGLVVRRDGLLQLGVQAAPIQPASLWTAITPGAGWTASGSITLGYAKDATGCVRLKGSAVYVSGSNPVFTLPAGFRPAGQINHLSMFAIGGPIVAVVISPTGTVTIQNQSTGALASGGFDGISFPAEA